MKLIIAGSRHFEEDIVYAKIVELRYKNHPIVQATEIVSGKAQGADTAGEEYADFYGQIPVKEFPAEWEKYGGRAGRIRNNKMAVYADALLLIWNGKSAGSRHMKQAMKELGKPVYELIFTDEEMQWQK